MASYIDAAALLTVAVAVVILQEPAGLTPVDIGVLTALLQACVAVGAMVGGRLGDRFGRRPVFTKTMIMIIAGGLMMIVGQSFWWFIMAQILIGLGSGADLPVSLATVADVATDDNRARLVGFSWPLWTIGIVVVQGLASLVGNLGVLGAHIMFLHLVVVAAVVAVLRPLIPEPTLWSATKAVESEAKPADLEPVSALHLLLKRPYARPFVALLLFSSLLGAAVNANGTLYTYLMVNVVGIDVAFASQLGLLLIPWNLLWSFVFVRVAAGSSRMKWFYFGSAVGLLAWFAPVLLGVTLPVMVGMRFLGSLQGNLANEGQIRVWTQEFFPTLLRATAQGTIIAFTRGAAALLTLFAPSLFVWDARLTYALFGGLAVVAVGCAIWGVREPVRSHPTHPTRLGRDSNSRPAA